MRSICACVLLVALLQFSNTVVAAPVSATKAPPKELVFSTFEKSYISRISEKVLRIAYKQMGYEIKFLALPPERGLVQANTGATDGDTHRKEDLEKDLYPNLIQVPVAINKANMVAFSKRNDITLKGWESLRSYKFGILRGQKFTEAKTAGMTKTFFVDAEKAIFAVGSGSMDLVVLTEMTGVEIIKQANYFGIIKVLQPPFGTLKLFHYLHKKHQDLIPQLTSILKQMEASGEIEKVYQELAAK